MSEENLDIESTQNPIDDFQKNTYLKKKRKNVGKEINKLLQKDLKNKVNYLLIRIPF